MDKEIKFEESPITEEDQIMINDSVTTIRKVYKDHFNIDLIEINPSHLDELLPYFKKGTKWNKKNRNIAVAVLGASLGHTLVHGLGFEWIIYKDDEGEELSLIHRTSNWRAFPFSSIQKRIKTKETGYFQALYSMFEKSVTEKNK